MRLGLMLLAGWHVLDSPFLLRLLWQKVGSGFSYASSRHDLSGRWNLAKHIFSLRLTDSRHHSDLLTLPAPPLPIGLSNLISILQILPGTHHRQAVLGRGYRNSGAPVEDAQPVWPAPGAPIMLKYGRHRSAPSVRFSKQGLRMPGLNGVRASKMSGAASHSSGPLCPGLPTSGSPGCTCKHCSLPMHLRS